MKNYIALLGFWFCLSATAQVTSIKYTSSDKPIANPERGLYKHTATSTKTYTALDAATLQQYKSDLGISLIYRNFQLNSFIYKNISADYLANMQYDFQVIRESGMKVIVRFSYSESERVRQRDASKLMILRHIQQLKPILQANSDVIALLQAGFIGTWGEWYYTSQADFGGWGYDETAMKPNQLANRKEIVTALLDALPTNRMLQLRNIDSKQNFFNLEPIQYTKAHNQTAVARIGFHNDCFLSNSTDSGTFSNPEEQRKYLAEESKFVPTGGETCMLNAPRTDCSSAMLEMKEFHWSYLNLDYYPEVINGFRKNDCLSEIEQKLGYRISLQSALLPKSIGLQDYLSLSITLKNEGFAAPFNPRKVYVVLRNATDGNEIKLPLKTDIRYWFGSSTFTLNENIKLPNNTPTGEYNMYLYFPDEAPSLASNPAYAIQLANTQQWDATTGYNSLNHVLQIQNGTISQIAKKTFDIALYPNPAHQVIIAQVEDCKSYQVLVHNAQGMEQNVEFVTEENELKIPTENLNNGLYFIVFTKNGISDTRKFVVKH
jgi:hypothetical protein